MYRRARGEGGGTKRTCAAFPLRSVGTVPRDVPWSMRVPTLVLAAACLVFGIAAFLPVGLAAEAARVLVP